MICLGAASQWLGHRSQLIVWVGCSFVSPPPLFPSARSGHKAGRERTTQRQPTINKLGLRKVKSKVFQASTGRVLRWGHSAHTKRRIPSISSVPVEGTRLSQSMTIHSNKPILLVVRSATETSTTLVYLRVVADGLHTLTTSGRFFRNWKFKMNFEIKIKWKDGNARWISIWLREGLATDQYRWNFLGKTHFLLWMVSCWLFFSSKPMTDGWRWANNSPIKMAPLQFL